MTESVRVVRDAVFKANVNESTQCDPVQGRPVVVLHPRLAAVVHDFPKVDVDQAGVFQGGFPSCLTIKSVTDYLRHRILCAPSTCSCHNRVNSYIHSVAVLANRNGFPPCLSEALRYLHLKRGSLRHPPIPPLSVRPRLRRRISHRQVTPGPVQFMAPSTDTGVWVSASSSADNAVASSGSIQTESRW